MSAKPCRSSVGPIHRTAGPRKLNRQALSCVLDSVAGNAPDRFLAPSSQVEHAGIAARDRRHTVRRLRNAGSTSTSASFAQPGARRAARTLALAQNVADQSSDPPAAVLRSARFSVLRGHIGTT